jgi:beta-ribofuranosylaminobenzene 5'-phosphate synthase
MIAF